MYTHLRRLGFYRNDSTDIEQPVQSWPKQTNSFEYVIAVEGTPVPVALTMRRGEAAATDAILDYLDDITATHGVVAVEDIRHPYTNDDHVL